MNRHRIVSIIHYATIRGLKSVSMSGRRVGLFNVCFPSAAALGSNHWPTQEVVSNVRFWHQADIKEYLSPLCATPVKVGSEVKTNPTDMHT